MPCLFGVKALFCMLFFFLSCLNLFIIFITSNVVVEKLYFLVIFLFILICVVMFCQIYLFVMYLLGSGIW